MRGITERTPLRRSTDSPDYVEFASLLRTRRTRLRQFQCCVCGILIVVFTMALVVSISYSMSHSNFTDPVNDNVTSLGSALRLGLALESISHSAFSSTTSATTEPKSVLVTNEDVDTSTKRLSQLEYTRGLRAGEQAMKDRLFADMVAAKSPLPPSSPEFRHRHAVSTRCNVSTLALAATGEIAATKMIEKMRSTHDKPSAIGTFFDSGWLPETVCKRFFNNTCKASKYRTIDGSCNRPRGWGTSMTPFRRAPSPDYADGIESPRKARSGKDLPSAREISLKVHKPSASSNPSFTVMLAVFGQFLDHDITATALSQGANGSSIACCPPLGGQHPECFPVQVGAGDPVYDLTGRTCMDFVRSAPAPRCKLGPREQLNQVSAFIDGSTIYGSDNEIARDLREFTGGRLRMQLTPDNRTLLPPSTNPNDGCNREVEQRRGRYCFVAGDARANENLHLTTMHLLWARQHNRIANELSRVNPAWSDETLYQEARRIVGAQLQHVTYREFLSVILGDKRMNEHNLLPLTSGYKKRTHDPDELENDPTIANHFAAAAFRFAHTLIPGLMRMTDAEKDTQSYMELHRMLFNPYSLYAADGMRHSVTSATTNVIQRYSTHVTSQLTNHLFEDPMANSTVPCGLDLVSLNIQRGRDHGLPGYTVWREYCGLEKVETFDDLVGHLDRQALEEISMLYETVGDVDLYTGALAEIPESDSLIGPTFTCLILDQFARLQKGDRFWYEFAEQPYPFTKDQLVEIRKSSLAKLICDCSDGIMHAQMRVMRSVGPDNPMVSCEDIPGPSFAAWKEDHASDSKSS
ncbi:peroxidase [Solenopsis invicta]|uniref:peroxidase n=1 Tax=Solenopsis invicta TaxID=13686 RepID=UPI00059621A6|nr:peroxidase [Solenopsis invicta]